jgi:hypothetical protein
MTDLTDFLSQPIIVKPPCNVEKWLAKQDADAVLAFKKAVLNPEWSIAALNKGLHDFGLAVSDETIRKHRNGSCRVCGPL